MPLYSLLMDTYCFPVCMYSIQYNFNLEQCIPVHSLIHLLVVLFGCVFFFFYMNHVVLKDILISSSVTVDMDGWFRWKQQ